MFRITSKGIASIFILIIIVILIGLGFVFYHWNSQIIVDPIRSPNPNSTLYPPIKQNVDTSDWETYQGPGYSLQYPSSFTLSETAENGFSGVALVHYGEVQKASGRTQTSLFDGVAIKTLVITGKGETAKGSADNSYKVDKDGTETQTGSISEIKQTVIGGKTTYYYEVHGMGDVNVYFLDLAGSVLRITVLYAGEDNVIPTYLALANEVLATLLIN